MEAATINEQLQMLYGDFLQQYETTYDYFEKRKIKNKLEAIETLLDINTYKS